MANITTLNNHKSDDNDGNFDNHECCKTLSNWSYDKRQHNQSVRMHQSNAPKYLQIVKKLSNELVSSSLCQMFKL